MTRVEDEHGGWAERTGPSSYRVHTTHDHVCGLQGFGALGDVCPACEQSRNLSANLKLAEMTPDTPKPPAPNRLQCHSCGAPDFYACGCYDRCRCGHDRRTHTVDGFCTFVGCECRGMLHGSAKSPSPASARHGYGCPRDGALMMGNCPHCCRHGWVESAQGKPCPDCYPPASAETLEQRLRARIENLVNRGREICPEYQFTADGTLHACAACGYTSDVHLLRDALRCLQSTEQALDTLWIWASEQRTHLESDPVPDALGRQVLDALERGDRQPGDFAGRGVDGEQTGARHEP